MSQVKNWDGSVMDLTAMENSTDPGQRARAQVVLAMDKWARSNGFGSWNHNPDTDSDADFYKFQAAQAAFEAQAIKEQAQNQDYLNAESLLVSSGDIVPDGKGGYVLSEAAAGDLARGGATRNYGAVIVDGKVVRNDTAVNEAAYAILSGAAKPATLGAFLAAADAAVSPLIVAPEVHARVAPPPNAGGASVVVTDPASGGPSIVTTAAPAATPAAPIPSSSASSSAPSAGGAAAVVGDERRTRQVLAWVAAGLVLLYLARR